MHVWHVSSAVLISFVLAAFVTCKLYISSLAFPSHLLGEDLGSVDLLGWEGRGGPSRRKYAASSIEFCVFSL